MSLTENLESLESGAKMAVSESHVTASLQPNPRRLWVVDTAFPAAEASKVWILDGTSAKIEGMFNMGYWPNM